MRVRRKPSRCCGAIRIVLPLLLGSVLGAACTTPVAEPRVTQTAPRVSAADERALGQRIRAALAASDVRGASVAIVERGEVLYQAGFGFAHESHEVSVTPSTVFHLGDASTLLLSTLALRLVDRGALRLDETLDQLIDVPVEPAAGAPHATVAHVLSHRSGFAPGPLAEFGSEQRPADYARRWTRLDDLRRERYGWHPGEIYAPTTMAMRVLAAGLSKRAGHAYERLVEEEVARPTGMLHTGFFGISPEPARYAEPFEGTEARYYRDVPALGAVSSAADMGRWLAVVLGDGTLDGKRVLSEAALEQLWAVQNAGAALDDGYEVRLGLVPVGQRRAMESAVGAQSFLSPHSALVWTIPSERVGVVAFATQRGQHDVLRRIAEESLQLATDGRIPPASSEETREHVVPLDERRALTGTYATPVGPVVVTASDTGLELAYDGYSFSLTPLRDGSYGVRYKVLGLVAISVDALKPFRIRFRTVDGRRYLYVYRRGVLYVTAQELRVGPPGEVWRSRVGQYKLLGVGEESLFSRVELTHAADADVLTFEMTLKKNGFKLRFAVEPLDDRRGVFAGKGHLMGSGLSFATAPGGESQLYFSGFLARRAP